VLPKLKKLSISFMEIDTPCFNKMMSLKNLTNLSLACKLENVSLLSLATNTLIRKLRITNTTLSTEHIQSICKNKSILHLHLNLNEQLNSECCGYLARSNSVLENVSRLCLNIKDTVALTDVIQCTRNLKALNLSSFNCRIHDDTVEAMCQITTLRKVTLDHTSVSEDSARMLLSATQLRILHLHDKVTNSHMECIAKNTSLEELNLCGEVISVDLFLALLRNTTLKSLTVNVGDMNPAEYLDELMANTSLTRLWLTMDESEHKRIVMQCKASTSLRLLHIALT
jgi:hypothetical protein